MTRFPNCLLTICTTNPNPELWIYFSQDDAKIPCAGRLLLLPAFWWRAPILAEVASLRLLDAQICYAHADAYLSWAPQQYRGKGWLIEALEKARKPR